MAPDPTPAIALRGVLVRRGVRTILGPLDWTVGDGERWVIVGPNGAGKTTLAQVASTYLWPTAGRVSILGQEIGTVDARELREQIGYAGSGLERAIPDDITAADLVVTARHAALGPWWHHYTKDDHARARHLLDRLGIGHLAETTLGVLSTGERRRAQIARALMPRPRLLILDEPAAGLDIGARESLIATLDELAADRDLAAIVLVSHHLEEIPPRFASALVLGGGAAIAAGPIERALASDTLSRAYGQPLRVEQREGRFTARGVAARS